MVAINVVLLLSSAEERCPLENMCLLLPRLRCLLQLIKEAEMLLGKAVRFNGRKVEVPWVGPVRLSEISGIEGGVHENTGLESEHLRLSSGLIPQ